MKVSHRWTGRALHSNSGTLTVVLLFIGALGLRLWGASWGLPYFFSGDEVTKRDSALAFLQTGFVHPPDHPSFTYNTLFLIYSAADVVRDNLTLAQYHYLGRVWMAVLGALTVVAVWRLGRRFDGTGRTGTIAALLLAVLPLHAACSRYIKEDVPLGLALVLGMLALVAYLGRPSRATLALAGFLTGVAFSTKYTGLLLVAPLAVTLLVVARRRRSPWREVALDVAAATLMVPAGFFLFSPIFLVHPGLLVEGFLQQTTYSATGHADIVANPWQEWWTFYIRKALIPGMTWPVFALTVGGLWLLVRRSHGWVLVFTSVLFYLVVEQAKARPEPFPARWLAPIVPLLCVAAGLAFVRVAEIIGRRTRPATAYVVCAVLFVAPPLVKSVLIAKEALQDTRLIAGRWMDEHVPAGSAIVVSEGLMTLPASAGWGSRWRIIDRDIGAGIDASWSGHPPPYFIFSSFKYQRFLDDADAVPDRTRFYETVRREDELIQEFRPRWFTYGRHSPVIQIFRPRDTAEGRQP